MTVAARRLGEKRWTLAKLDSTLGWDSHNYVTMAIDRTGCLHVCGNMHVAPLVYFRSEQPLDVSSLRRVPAMTGGSEKRVTYPGFFRTAEGTLLFLYRDGKSGDGRTLVNGYDETTRTWTRYLDAPLLDGTSRSMNAYPADIRRGPDGFFHLVWMWREPLTVAATFISRMPAAAISNTGKPRGDRQSRCRSHRTTSMWSWIRPLPTVA